MNNLLILLTKKFPFGKGEEFLEIELLYLSERFDKIILLSCESSKNDYLTKKVPDNTTIIRINNYSSIFKFPIYIIKGATHLFTNGFLNEVKRVKTIKAILGCLYYQGKMLSTFKKLSIKLLKEKMNYKNITIYSYWFNDTAQMACKIREKYFKSNTLVVSRGHGYDLYEERSMAKIIPYREWCLGQIDKVYPCSINGKEYLKANYPNYADKVETSYLGTCDNGTQQYKRNDVFHIVTCSNLIPLKRVSLLANALKILVDKDIRNIRWTCIGSGILLNDLKKFAKRELENIDTRFTGHIPNNQVIDFYKNNPVDVFVNVSISEGLPVSIMEVQSFGIPSIATDVGGVNEIVIDGVTGSLIKAEITPEELANTILFWLEKSTEDISKIRENCRNNWYSKFNAESNYRNFATEIQVNN